MATYEIYPRVGIARVGNSPDGFYLGPDAVGGLPLNCDQYGNACGGYVKEFKDSIGRIKRQASKFQIFKKTADGVKQVDLSCDDVVKIEWTVHIANKKPIWYTFSELQGDLEFGEENSYAKQHVPRNNANITDATERKKLIIDPGPRSIDKPLTEIDISRYNIPDDYPFGSFPSTDNGGQQIDSLGKLTMDKSGSLVVIPGNGNVTGSAKIDSFRGAGGYWDDIADGFVLATIHFANGSTVDVEPSWLLVGSPKYAPELVNITTLYDTMYNVGIQNFQLDADIYDPEKYSDAQFPLHQGYTPLKGYNPNYQVNYHRDIAPIIERIKSYRWVVDVPYLQDFANPGFDMQDSSEKNRKNRETYFSYFRIPVLPKDYKEFIGKVKNGPNQLFSEAGIPLMPLNSGDNSVTNTGPVYKFETLSATQYFFMYQWSVGNFTTDAPAPESITTKIDEANVGNCVGAPFSPGIETTWIVRNASIYSEPFKLKVAHYDDAEGMSKNQSIEAYYRSNGLSITADEAEGSGCEPGDLTKRMAIPWQADFHECTVQTPNISHIDFNQFQSPQVQVPPAYYVYWWPPQSPMNVVAGSLDPGDQVLEGLIDGNMGVLAAGQKVSYQRGIDSTNSMIQNWWRLGFVVNQSTDEAFPYLTEQERDSRGLAQQITFNNEAIDGAAK